MRKNLMILPFDHRGSFKRTLVGSADITKKQHKELEELKFLVYEAFLAVYKKYPNKDELAILVDEEFGAKVLRDAKKRGIQICLTAEKTGQKEFGFEYGNSFGKHIDKFKPDYVKALVRYNPLNKKINEDQIKKLERLNEYCIDNNYALLIELLVPPTEKDLKFAGSEKKYEKKLRITRTVGAINQIKAKIDVDVWKLEGFSKVGWKRIVRAVPNDSDIIVLGKGEDSKKVKKWLMSAKRFDKIIGFAVGRTIFLNALKKYYSGKISRKRAIDIISSNYLRFINLWNK